MSLKRFVDIYVLLDVVQKGAKFGRLSYSAWWEYSPGPTGVEEYCGFSRLDFDKKPSLPSVGIMSVSFAASWDNYCTEIILFVQLFSYTFSLLQSMINTRQLYWLWGKPLHAPVSIVWRHSIWILSLQSITELVTQQIVWIFLFCIKRLLKIPAIGWLLKIVQVLQYNLLCTLTQLNLNWSGAH